jgi:hypothetical protein
MPDASPAANPQGPPPQQPGGSPPFGAQGAPTPSPNRGYEAAGLQRLGNILVELNQIETLLGPGSEPGKAVAKAISQLSKYVPPGSVTPSSQNQMAQRMMQSSQQNNAQMQALQRMQQQGAGGAPGGAPGGQPQMRPQ